jgi:hypothetical protein
MSEITLTEAEQDQVDMLEDMHKRMDLEPGSDEERDHVRIQGSNGMVGWKAQIVYAENHNCPVPHWAQEYREHFGV